MSVDDEDSDPPGLETDKLSPNEDKTEPSRSHTDVDSTDEGVEQKPDSFGLKADEAWPLLVGDNEDHYLWNTNT